MTLKLLKKISRKAKYRRSGMFVLLDDFVEYIIRDKSEIKYLKDGRTLNADLHCDYYKKVEWCRNIEKCFGQNVRVYNHDLFICNGVLSGIRVTNCRVQFIITNRTDVAEGWDNADNLYDVDETIIKAS